MRTQIKSTASIAQSQMSIKFCKIFLGIQILQCASFGNLRRIQNLKFTKDSAPGVPKMLLVKLNYPREDFSIDIDYIHVYSHLTDH